MTRDRYSSRPAVDSVSPSDSGAIDELLIRLDSFPIPRDGFIGSLRALALGAAVIVGGSLVMSTVIGIAAVSAMLISGQSPEMIVAALPHSFHLVLFTAAGSLVMSIAGGYTAAYSAGHAHVRYALIAGAAGTVMNVVLMIVIGNSGPGWLTFWTTVLTVPCAMLGGWSAAPDLRRALPSS